MTCHTYNHIIKAYDATHRHSTCMLRLKNNEHACTQVINFNKLCKHMYMYMLQQRLSHIQYGYGCAKSTNWYHKPDLKNKKERMGKGRNSYMYLQNTIFRYTCTVTCTCITEATKKTYMHILKSSNWNSITSCVEDWEGVITNVHVHVNDSSMSPAHN